MKNEGMREITVLMPEQLAKKVRHYAREYRTSMSGMIVLVATYYFGDWKDHLRCEHCVYGEGETCSLEEPESSQDEIRDETTVPLLDKGTVVVGLSTADQGKRENGKSVQQYV